MCIIFQKWKISIVEVVENLEHWYIAGRNIKWYSHCGKQSGGCSKVKRNYHMTQKFHPKYIPKRTENRCSNKYLYTQMFIATLFIIAKKQKQLKCPLTKEWINKRQYIHTTEYYSVIKRNEVLTHTKIWMNLKNMLLNERSQIQKSHIV